MPRTKKTTAVHAPHGFKADGTPYRRKPQARYVAARAAREARSAQAVDVPISDASQDFAGVTGAMYTEMPAAPAAPASPLDVQVGGGHYKDMAIQPVEFIHRNNLSFLQGCIIKRICRYKTKDGVRDLEKIKHEVDLLIAMEYGMVAAK